MGFSRCNLAARMVMATLSCSCIAVENGDSATCGIVVSPLGGGGGAAAGSPPPPAAEEAAAEALAACACFSFSAYDAIIVGGVRAVLFAAAVDVWPAAAPGAAGTKPAAGDTKPSVARGNSTAAAAVFFKLRKRCYFLGLSRGHRDQCTANRWPRTSANKHTGTRKRGGGGVAEGEACLRIQKVRRPQE